MVIDNLDQLGALADALRVLMASTPRSAASQYCALSEIGQLQLSLDTQIMADADSQEDLQSRARGGDIDTRELCRSIR